MDGVDVAEALKRLADLPDAVPVVVEQDHLEVAIIVCLLGQGIDDSFIIRRVGVDEDQFETAGLLLRNRLGLGRFEVLVENEFGGGLLLEATGIRRKNSRCVRRKQDAGLELFNQRG